MVDAVLCYGLVTLLSSVLIWVHALLVDQGEEEGQRMVIFWVTAAMDTAMVAAPYTFNPSLRCPAYITKPSC